MKWSLIADDLSGACESASAINRELNSTKAPLRSYLAVTLFSPEKSFESSNLSIVDLNIRDRTSADALFIFSNFLASGIDKSPQSNTFFKVDSLLRGHIAMQVDVLAKKNPLIFIPAVPSLNRTVKNGEVYIQDVALNQSDLWKDEAHSAPKIIDDLFLDIKAIHCSLESLNEIEKLLAGLHPGEILIPDIHSAQDLDFIAELLPKYPSIVALGSAEFALAHFQAFRGDEIFLGQDLTPRQGASATAIVGSNSAMSLAQYKYLQSPEHQRHSAEDLVVKVEQGDNLDDLRKGDFLDQLLFISGGTTARALLDSLGISQLRMLDSLQYGVALGVSEENQLIGIKPGSFGKEDTISKSLIAMSAISTLSNRN